VVARSLLCHADAVGRSRSQAGSKPALRIPARRSWFATRSASKRTRTWPAPKSASAVITPSIRRRLLFRLSAHPLQWNPYTGYVFSVAAKASPVDRCDQRKASSDWKVKRRSRPAGVEYDRAATVDMAGARPARRRARGDGWTTRNQVKQVRRREAKRAAREAKLAAQRPATLDPSCGAWSSWPPSQRSRASWRASCTSQVRTDARHVACWATSSSPRTPSGATTSPRDAGAGPHIRSAPWASGVRRAGRRRTGRCTDPRARARSCRLPVPARPDRTGRLGGARSLPRRLRQPRAGGTNADLDAPIVGDRLEATHAARARGPRTTGGVRDRLPGPWPGSVDCAT
jgi:hypothetical protein